MVQTETPAPTPSPTVRFGLRYHACETTLSACFPASIILAEGMAAFHGVYAPAPGGFGARLIAVGFATWIDGQSGAGTLTSVTKTAFRPSLARLLGIVLPRAGVQPHETRDRTLTVFSHFHNPTHPDHYGARHAFSHSLPAASLLGRSGLRVRVPFGPSQVYAVDVSLTDTTCFLSSIQDLEEFVSHLKVPIVGVTQEERANPDLLRIFHPDRLCRYAAQRAELTLFGGSIRAARHL